MIRACLLAVSTLLSPELVELQVGRDHCLFLSFLSSLAISVVSPPTCPLPSL